jgi:hypothetical protein
VRAYLASNYSRREELLGYAAILRGLGHEVTSTWIDGHHETRPNIDETGTGDEQAMWADEDISDLIAADTLILFTGQPGPRMRGGCHTEFGFALAAGFYGSDCRLIVVGPKVNVFHHLSYVEHYEDFAALLGKLREGVPA